MRARTKVTNKTSFMSTHETYISKKLLKLITDESNNFPLDRVWRKVIGSAREMREMADRRDQCS